MKFLKGTILFFITAIFLFTTVGFVHGFEITAVLPMGPETEFIRSRMPVFEYETGISVHITTYAEGQYRENILVDLMGGTGSFDLLAVDSVYIPVLAEIGRIEPVNEFFGVAWETEDYNRFVLDVLSYEAQLYAVPYSREVSILFYREDLLEEAGLSPPQNFEELEAHAQKLIHVPDIYPFAVRAAAGEGNNVYAWIHWLRAYGGEFFDPEGQPVFDSPVAVEATEHYTRILHTYAPAPLTELDQWKTEALFALGAVAMTIESHTLYGRLESPGMSRVAGNIGYAPVPEGPAGQHPGNRIFGLVIATDAYWEPEKVDAVKAFVRWITSKDMDRAKRDLAGITSFCRDSLFFESEFVETVRADWLEAVFEGFERTSSDFRPRIPEWFNLADRLSIALEGVTTGALSAEEALVREHEYILEEIERMEMIEEAE